MFNFFKKLFGGDQKGWRKVSDIKPGMEIAVPSKTGNLAWDEIVSITPVGREQVYDIEVEGTHNFVGNDIFAHNTYVLKADNLTANAPADVLNADGSSVDVYKLATYALGSEQTLAAKVDADETEMASLEARVEKLESGEVSAASNSPVNFSNSTLASAFSGLGAFIQNGIAQFGILVADQFVAATNSAGTSSAGTITVLAGNTVAQVTNAYVNPSSKIFVTLTASTTGSWYISDKQNGSFKLVLSEPQANDVSFDYFIVQTEGQIATSTPTSNFGNSPSTSSGQVSITLLGDNPAHVSVGGTFVDPGVQAAGPVTTYINGVQQTVSSTTIDTSSPTTYVITYSTTDASGKVATAIRSVVVGNPGGTVTTNPAPVQTPAPASTDTTPPTVTLNGDAAMQMNQNDSFTDPGATAIDPSTGSGQATDLTSKIVETGSVNVATAGLYTLTYTATDAAGNTTSVSRVVTVLAAAPAPSTPAPSDSSSSDSSDSSTTTP